MNKFKLTFIFQIIILGLFIPFVSIFAVVNSASIIINIQPASTGNVDSIFSQQPVLLVQDANKNPLPGVTVTAVTNGLGDLKGNLSEVTDSNGLATFTNLGYSGTDSFQIIFASSAGKAISNSIKLSYGAVDASHSSISVSPSTVIADNQSLATIIISCEDQYGNMIPGADVGVSVSGSENTLTQPNSSDKPGITSVNLTSTKAESKIISVKINGVSLGNSDPVNFISGKIAKLIISADSPISTSQTSKIIIEGKDSFGNNVANDSLAKVVLSADNGGSLSTALVTFVNGEAFSSLNKNLTGQVNLTASVGDVSAETKILFTSADNTAPTILNQYPLSDAKNIPADVIPYIDFSKAIDDTTLTTNNVELKNYEDDTVVPIEVLVANGGRRVILQPASNLKFNKKYYLFLSSDIKDSYGNNLTSNYTAGAFTTTSDLQASSSVQEKNIIQDAKIVNSTNEKVNSSSGPTNNSSENLVNNSETNNASINVKSGSTSENSTVLQNGKLTNDIAGSAQAGLLEIIKKINFSEFGEWFVSNFTWIIIITVILILGYIFWFFYIK